MNCELFCPSLVFMRNKTALKHAGYIKSFNIDHQYNLAFDYFTLAHRQHSIFVAWKGQDILGLSATVKRSFKIIPHQIIFVRNVVGILKIQYLNRCRIFTAFVLLVAII